ncbi:hypothetical protein CHS0354_040789 [Potamilus streckersoni]|uniref:Uncharacterized protein n=1 Tax=Potamilus streckersoni TaxID=2493646 RepID=A0AAE0VXR5_9BIVA|nr:hypothetical protein CHS0354_040789 [Potamilus streckersoni]
MKLICQSRRSVVMYTRYKQIEKFYRGSSRKNLMRANTISFVLGMTACLGVSIVGNFQGYIEHLVSTISEWAAALLTAIFIATFTGEFRKFRLKAPEIIYSEIHEKSNKKMHVSAISGPKVLDCDSHEELDKDMNISAITGPKVLDSDIDKESN